MITKNKMRFWEEDKGGKGGGGGLLGGHGPQVSRGMEAVSDDEPKEKIEVVEEKKVETPAAPTVDAATLAKAFATELRSHDKERKEPKVEELTEEQAKKLLNIWEPSDEWIAKFDNLATRKEALKELRDGTTRQNDTITRMRIKEALDEIKPGVQAATEFMENYKNEQAEKRFNVKYPDLAKPELKKVIGAVADELTKAGKTFETEEELFKALAEGVTSVMKVSNPNFKLSDPGSNPGKKPGQTTTNAIPTTTPGGGGGGGGKGDDTAKPRGLSIFDK